MPAGRWHQRAAETKNGWFGTSFGSSTSRLPQLSLCAEGAMGCVWHFGDIPGADPHSAVSFSSRPPIVWVRKRSAARREDDVFDIMVARAQCFYDAVRMIALDAHVVGALNDQKQSSDRGGAVDRR